MMNRVIGFLVVIALGVLVLPFFWNTSDTLLQAEAVKTPPFPNQKAQNDTIRALGDYNTAFNDNKFSKFNIKNVAWVIQVASFNNKFDALQLVNQLRNKKYNAFIYQKGAAFNEETQVYIGPEVKKDTAEVIALRLAKETKLSGTIKSYKPLAA